MATTIFLAHLWGPALIAVGIGFFTNRRYYLKVYENLKKETLAMLIFGMAGIAVGILHIDTHNTWSTLPEILISFLGWALLVKAFFFAIIPEIVDKMSNYWVRKSWVINMCGVSMIVIGIYLTWFAYF